MKSRTKKRRTSRSRARNGGSALLISLMVVMGLSMLGLAFVAISETEGAISMNQRHALQTQAIAEAGAKAAVEWFQDPVWARNQGIVPVNLIDPSGVVATQDMKRTRIINGYTGVYKPLLSDLLFDRPYRPAPQHRFLGSEEKADITINHTIDNTTMVALNTYLFGSDSRVNGRISEILVYAPPMIGATLNANGFWENGERFGTATIKVTAEKWSQDAGGTLQSSQAVRVIIGEFPLPVPGGPIQSAANLDFGGSLNVYWGNETALGDLNTSITLTRLPWLNPFERPHFERGYDGLAWPILTTSPDNVNSFTELVGKRFLDPWAGNRARGAVNICGACGAYTNTSVEGQPIWAAFQNQIATVYPTSKEVTFPTIKYDVWKKIALQGRGMKGLYYFTHNTGNGLYYLNGTGTGNTIEFWVNNNSPGSRLGPGFYFFDTTTAANPQQLGGTTNAAILTPDEAWGASEIVSDFKMVGFIYMNVRTFRTTGGNNNPPTGQYNMPGEVYRDVGYHRIDKLTGDWVLSSGAKILDGAGDGEWSFQDVNDNGQFDVVVTGPADMTSNDPGAVTHTNQYVPKTWDEATCTIPDASGVYVASDCSEPHEPYLNMIYPAQDDPYGTAPPGNADDGVLIGWEAEGSQTRRPRDLTGTTVPDCAVAANYVACTSNKHDKDGALVDIKAMVHGVLYNEGDYSAQGGIQYFGAVLIRGGGAQVNSGGGGVEGNGSVELFFDEKLVKEDWRPPGMIRVIIYSMQTDEN